MTEQVATGQDRSRYYALGITIEVRHIKLCRALKRPDYTADLAIGIHEEDGTILFFGCNLDEFKRRMTMKLP
jgi:hypothetical protein